MKSSEHIQVAPDPATLRAGPPVTLRDWPRLRRLTGRDLPRVTRRVPTVEIIAGAALGLTVGIAWGIWRLSGTDVLAGMFFGPLFGLLIGWLIATFTGATGTLSTRTVLANMVHIVWVLTVAIFFVGIFSFLAALAGAAYGPDSRDM